MKLSELPGVGEAIEKKFVDAGIIDADSVLNYSPDEIMEVTGMNSISVKKMFNKILTKMREDKLIPPRFRPGREVGEDRKDVEFIDLGVDAFKKLFGNGIETKATTEFYGEFGSGKTQLCHTAAVRSQFSKKDGGLGGKVLWIDSEDTFRPERIISICEMQELDSDKFLDGIIHAKAFNSTDQQLILEEAEQILKKENIRLIIVDSSTGLFRSGYVGRGTLSNRQGEINKFVTRASRISQNFNIAVILTNQVYSSPDQQWGDSTRPVGGHIMAHSSTYRIYFKKSGKFRIAKMVDSPGHPETEVMFGLSAGGVVDMETKEKEIKELAKEKKKEKKK